MSWCRWWVLACLGPMWRLLTWPWLSVHKGRWNGPTLKGQHHFVTSLKIPWNGQNNQLKHLQAANVIISGTPKSNILIGGSKMSYEEFNSNLGWCFHFTRPPNEASWPLSTLTCLWHNCKCQFLFFCLILTKNFAEVFAQVLQHVLIVAI